MTSLCEDGLSEPYPVGKTAAARQRNTALLGGYDYDKYPGPGITGYTGQDRQRISVLRYQEAVRPRVGPRGNYKAGFTRLGDGRLLIAACRGGPESTESSRIVYRVYVYDSVDNGLSWQQIGCPDLLAKELSLTALPNGVVLMTGSSGRMWLKPEERYMQIAHSADGGRSWETDRLTGTVHPNTFPRNVIVEQDGSLLFLRLDSFEGCNLELLRSRDDGRSWTTAPGKVNWDAKDKFWFTEVSALRLTDGTLLAALRRQIPGTHGEGFEDTVITRSDDNGTTWAKPVRIAGTSEVHTYLTELSDGRILATYANYHLPYGVCALVSEDNGRTWDRDRPVQLSLSADLYQGWPVTLQLCDGSLITSYAATTYIEEPPDKTTCEVVRWRPPW